MYVGERRPLPGPVLTELARDADRLLYQLPAEVALSLWRNWRSRFARRNDSVQYLWFDALFELAWQGRPGDALHVDRYAWIRNSSVQLQGESLFPRIPNELLAVGASIPHEMGHPMAYYAKIPDVARASLAAIDLILERGRTSAIVIANTLAHSPVSVVEQAWEDGFRYIAAKLNAVLAKKSDRPSHQCGTTGPRFDIREDSTAIP